ncbi:BofC C-terminal domain-containing protein [Aeribacillus alveayuensis]|uniref:Forespore regulator of the sigma-K checkpoint n=1 Tax=Aeribacillus alveayuensis TaxID=279215 RepID=A0ABT9VJR2_9BACI|nr:forespore regulator of the sigma-K checkpoint [Bacillus alveayuensis]
MKQLNHLFMIISALIVFISVFQNGKVFANEFNQHVKNEGSEISHPLTVKVVLERLYMDGERSEEVKIEKIYSMDDFLLKYADWQFVEHNKNKIVFRKYIEDISPLLKTNGYFGLKDDGTLSIFNGRPGDAKNIIQSFFQIDVGKLESRLHLELEKGIPIKNKEKYLEVIETFRQYSISKDS